MKSLRKQIILWGSLAFGLALSACAEEPGPADVLDRIGPIGQYVPVQDVGTFVDILPSELEPMLQTGDTFLVNVHVPDEGEIPGTQAHIAFDQVMQRLAEYPEKKDTRIVTYGRSGGMGAIAARDLVTAGYTNVFNLDGGFRAWIEAGYTFDS